VVLRVVLRSISTLYIGFLGQELLYRLRSECSCTCNACPTSITTLRNPANTLAIMTSDISTLSKLLQDGLINFVVQALMLVIITGVLFYMDVSLALILLCTVVPAILGTTLCSGASPERSFARRGTAMPMWSPISGRACTASSRSISSTAPR